MIFVQAGNCRVKKMCFGSAGMIAPDQTTIDYIKGRPLAPKVTASQFFPLSQPPQKLSTLEYDLAPKVPVWEFFIDSL